MKKVWQHNFSLGGKVINNAFTLFVLENYVMLIKSVLKLVKTIVFSTTMDGMWGERETRQILKKMLHWHFHLFFLFFWVWFWHLLLFRHISTIYSQTKTPFLSQPPLTSNWFYVALFPIFPVHLFSRSFNENLIIFIYSSTIIRSSDECRNEYEYTFFVRFRFQLWKTGEYTERRSQKCRIKINMNYVSWLLFEFWIISEIFG